ncbi:MAG: hypothetical protein KBF83_12060, partial [Pyrinomonadaceae bacterium]|nr:hypothetical protein [Pyrinomonadaceae bacterium]
MPTTNKRVSLIIFVVATLLLVGLVPLVMTGWLLSEKSGRELRSAENRYQIQLVQEKARQIEMFGRRWTSIVSSLSTALELSNDPAVISSAQTEIKLGSILREQPELVALYVKPANSDSLSVFRSEALTREQVEAIAAEMSAYQGRIKIRAGEPKQFGTNGQSVMPFASSVMLNGVKAADIVAIASLQQISQSVVGMNAANEADLWKAGLPMVFVVDGAGRAIFHPDSAVVRERKPMADLKIVDEWLESGLQVQSALVPFTGTYNEISHEMIGAYSTAEIADGFNVGVIAMQDETRALASVGEMRNQTWLISMAFALFALIAGLILSRYLTSPIMRLVGAAKQIADGDYSGRVDTQNITEVGT